MPDQLEYQQMLPKPENAPQRLPRKINLVPVERDPFVPTIPMTLVSMPDDFDPFSKA